jgi:hypothetical protein
MKLVALRRPRKSDSVCLRRKSLHEKKRRDVLDMRREGRNATQIERPDALLTKKPNARGLRWRRPPGENDIDAAQRRLQKKRKHYDHARAMPLDALPKKSQRLPRSLRSLDVYLLVETLGWVNRHATLPRPSSAQDETVFLLHSSAELELSQWFRLQNQ